MSSSAKHHPAPRRVSRRGWLLMLAWLLLAPVIPAASLDSDPEFQAARQAFAAGFPLVTASKTRRLLAAPAAGWNREDLGRLAALDAEANIRSGRPDAVLELLDDPALPKPDGLVFWRGQALLMLGEADEAEEVLRDWEKAGDRADLARLCLAQAFIAQGREAPARRELQALRESPDPFIARRARLMFNEAELLVERERTVIDRLSREPDASAGDISLVRARALFQTSRLGEALEETRRVRSMPGGGQRRHLVAALLEAEILLGLERYWEAQDGLLQFMQSAPAGATWLADAFQLLDRIRHPAGGEQPPPHPVLIEWISSPAASQRRGHALYHVASWLQSQDRAAEAAALLETLISLHPGHVKESAALLRLVRLHGMLRHDDRALALSEHWRQTYGGAGISLVEHAAGAVLYHRGDYDEALARFQRAADLAIQLDDRVRALYNAAVAALRAGETAALAAFISQLDVAAPVSDAASQPATSADLELDQALELAARGDRGAALELSHFTDTHPGHPRWAEAQLALADLALLDTPPRVKAAEAALELAAQRAPAGSELLARIHHTRIWCREADDDPAGLITAATAFLEQWAASSLAPNVRMKMAEAHFREEDFANAQTQFEIVARSSPESPLAESALFFAGSAAMNLRNLDAAIDLWDEVATQDGPLALAARIQQAVASRRAGRETDAIKVLDTILGGAPATAAAGGWRLDSDTRLRLQIERAEILILLGESSPRHQEEAVTQLRAIIGEPGLHDRWSARASFLLATALQKAGREAEALEAVTDLITRLDPDLDDSPDTLTWFYRAGFLAIDLLEKQNQFESAARVAEQLASTPGDQAVEAKSIATRIRLEHFLWDEKGR